MFTYCTHENIQINKWILCEDRDRTLNFLLIDNRTSECPDLLVRLHFYWTGSVFTWNSLCKLKKRWRNIRAVPLFIWFSSCSNGYRTFCCSNNSVSVTYFQFWQQWRAAYYNRHDVWCFFSLSIHFYKFIMPNDLFHMRVFCNIAQVIFWQSLYLVNW